MYSNNNSEKPVRQILFIGLGVMGEPMARNLADYLNESVKSSHLTSVQLLIFNRTYTKVLDFVKKYQNQFAQIELIAIDKLSGLTEKFSKIDLVISCIRDDESLKEILMASNTNLGLISSLAKGCTIIDHSSISAKGAREIYFFALENSIDFLDAPISGGQVGAEKGELAIMIGGNKAIFNKYLELLKAYGKNIAYMGDSGSGQLAKMCNQICITGLLQSLSESIIFAEKAGLDVENLIAIISSGAAGSWQMENRSITMHKRKFNFGFAVDLMLKDLKNTLNQAKDWDLNLPVSELVYDFYQQLSNNGNSNLDTSSLIKRLK